MPSLVELAARYQTTPVGEVHDIAELGEYLCVGVTGPHGEPLEHFDLDSGMATRCGAWWRVDGDGYFVEARTSETASGRPPGLYARSGPNTPYVSSTLLGVFGEAAITRRNFELLLSLLHSHLTGFGNPPKLTPEYTYIGPLETAA